MQVYVLYVGLLLGALNRLPIKLPRRGAGRRHNSGVPAQSVTFDDVAGVDEAKEELSEIVVRCSTEPSLEHKLVIRLFHRCSVQTVPAHELSQSCAEEGAIQSQSREIVRALH
jgi:hypothetical protein